MYVELQEGGLYYSEIHQLFVLVSHLTPMGKAQWCPCRLSVRDEKLPLLRVDRDLERTTAPVVCESWQLLSLLSFYEYRQLSVFDGGFVFDPDPGAHGEPVDPLPAFLRCVTPRI